MALLLTILKWIGIGLLCILAFFVLVFCYFLFLPMHYEFYGENQEEGLHYRLQARGFLHFWQMHVSDQEEFIFSIYAFWGLLKVYPWKQKKQTEFTPEVATEQPESVLDEEDIAEILEDKEVEYIPETIEKTSDFEKKSHNKKRKKKKEKSNRTSRWKEFYKKCKDEHNKSAVSFIFQKVLWFLKKSKPRIIKADLDFSVGDPAYTGLATGVLSLFPVCYGKRIRICPDFERDEIYAKGFIQIKGIVFFVHIVYLIISIICNKECRRLIKKEQ